MDPVLKFQHVFPVLFRCRHENCSLSSHYIMYLWSIDRTGVYIVAYLVRN